MLDVSAKNNPKKKATVRYVCEFAGKEIFGDTRHDIPKRVEDSGSIFGFVRNFQGDVFQTRPIEMLKVV